MGLLIWFTMGLAIWHFSVWVPDRFLGGIVGALVAAVVGSTLFGLVVTGIRGVSTDFADLGTVLVAIPGALIALGASWIIGDRQAESHH